MKLTENIEYIFSAEEFFKNIVWTTKMKIIISKSTETKRIKIKFKMIIIVMIMMMMIVMAAIVG